MEALKENSIAHEDTRNKTVATLNPPEIPELNEICEDLREDVELTILSETPKRTLSLKLGKFVTPI